MPIAQEILVHIERAQARHFKAAGLLFAGNGGGLLAFMMFKEALEPPAGVMIVVSSIGLAGDRLSAQCVGRRRPTARPLILLNMSSVPVGLAAMIATSVVGLVWFVMGW